MNKVFAYLLGALKDGSIPKIRNNKFEVTFACDWYKPWLENVIGPKVIQTFGLEPSKIKIYSVWDRKSNRPYFRLKVYSKDIYKNLINFYSPGNQEVWTTPKVIEDGRLEFQVEYVKGFYDAEGGSRDVEKFLDGKTKSMNCDIRIRCKHFKNPNEPLEFIKIILNRFEIKSSINKTNDSLIITGKKNVLNFYKNFTTLHSRKRKMIEKLLQYYGVLVSVEA